MVSDRSCVTGCVGARSSQPVRLSWLGALVIGVVVLLSSGCATMSEIGGTLQFAARMRNAMVTGEEVPEEELRAIADRPPPNSPGVAFDIALQRVSLAALALGDIDRIRTIREMAVRSGTDPNQIATVLGTAALAEDFAGNYIASMREQEAALKYWRLATARGRHTRLTDRGLISCLHNLGVSALRVGDFAAIEKVNEELAKIAQDDQTDGYVRALAPLAIRGLNAGVSAERDGDFAEAYRNMLEVYRHFRETAERFDTLSDPVTTAGSADMLASLVRFSMASGRPSLASAHVEDIRKLSDATTFSARLIAEIQYLEGIGDYAKALEVLEASETRLLHQIDMRWLAPRMKAAARHAALLEAMGQWSNAHETLVAVPNAVDAPPSPAREHYLGLRALAAVMADVDDPGTKLFLDLQGHGSRVRGSDALLRYYATKTIIHYQLGRRRGSDTEFARAVAAGREMAEVLRRIRSSGERLGSSLPIWLVDMAKEAYAASASAAQGERGVTDDDLLQAVMVLQMSEVSEDIAAAAIRRSSIPGLSRAQLRRLQDLQLESRRAQRKFSAAAQADDADPATLTVLAGQASKASELLDTYLAKFQTSATHVTQALEGSARFSLPELQRRLGARNGLVVFAPLGDASTLAMLVRRGGAQHKILPVGGKELTRLVGAIRRSVAFDAEGSVPAFDAAASGELYEHLFGWMEDSLAPLKSVTVVANGPLARIPFALLLTPDAAPNRAQAYRDLPWLIRALAIDHAPSISAWYVVTRPKAASTAHGFLAWADPDFAGQPETGTSAATRTVRASPGAFLSNRVAQLRRIPPNLADLLPRLPETLDEAAAIARALGASPQRDVISGAAATRASVLRQSQSGVLVRQNVLLFATHALVPAQLPGLDQPALVMAQEPGTTTPSLLQLDDVVGLNIDADLVLLSACNTAASAAVRGDPLSGLTDGFFFAGARALLVTHWEVETLSAAEITTRTIQRLARHRGMTRAEALRQTSLDLIAARTTPAEWSHPAFWAAYAIVGNGGRTSTN